MPHGSGEHVDRARPRDFWTRRSVWLFMLVSLALRVPGMFHDFWFDEAWSYLLVRQFVSSPLDVLTRVHIDNNHPLNSWFLYALGDRTAWFIYRIPSLVLGVASVALAGRIMARRGGPHAAAAMILVGGSYPLIVYASEARGYGPMIFFVLLAIEAYESYRLTRGWPALITFWAAIVLGSLSHLSFLHVYAAILLWWLYDERQRTARVRDAAKNLAIGHAVPLLFLATLYAVYVRHLGIAGGEPAGLRSVIAETLAVTLGA